MASQRLGILIGRSAGREITKKNVVPILSIGAFLVATFASAQESASFKLEESVLNGGGGPRDGVVLSSASFQITLHSIGEDVASPVLAGSTFLLQGGFVATLRPASEVANLRFTGPADLSWNAEPSVGDYAVYRGSVEMPFDPAFGACVGADVAAETFNDLTVPGSGAALFYLVTARNRLGEEGTKGAGSDTIERANPAPCP